MTTESRLVPLVGIALFCILMGAGQMLFKVASIKAKSSPDSFEMIRVIAFSPHFWIAGLLYAVASVLWVVILTRVPLSIAYPATSLTIVLVPLASWFFFGDTLNLRICLGMMTILLGVWLIASR